MDTWIDMITKEWTQYAAFAILSLVVIIFVGALTIRDPGIFQPYFGTIHPILGVILVVLLGFILLSYLMWRGWFDIVGNQIFQGILVASALAGVFGLVIILVDLKAVFPEDTNQLFPQSLFFYPAIGYGAEIVFHILPLTILLVTLTSVFKSTDFEQLVWICILIVALVDPIYQINFGISRQYPVWLTVIVGVHVFLINFSQLWVFKRYDFISMYSLRLVYYMIWHVIWGYLRLKLLF